MSSQPKLSSETPDSSDESSGQNPELKEMAFLEHLSELRTCLIRTAIAIFACSVVCLIGSEILFEALTAPLKNSFSGASLIGTGPAEAFIVKLKVAFVAGILLSSPYSFYQLWQFIKPGLHEHEQKFAIPFVFASTLFFLTGVAFCYFAILPFAFQFFSSEFASLSITPTIKIGEYLSFVVKLLAVFGLSFEMPVLCFFLARLNIVTSEFLIKNFRYAVLIILIVAAILTPPDVDTQLLLSAPLLVLYGLCIIICKKYEKTPGVTPQSN